MVLLRLVRQIMPVSVLPKKCLMDAHVELDVISIVALRGPALLEEMDVVITQNAAAAHAVLMELARLCRH